MAARRADVLAKGLPYLVAEDDGRVLGFAYCQWFKPRPAYRFSAEDSIYLHPDAAGRGLGKQLLAALARAGRSGRRAQADRGDRRLGQRGLDRRAPRAGLHARRHASQSCGWKFGRWLDIVLMEKALGEGDSTPPRSRDEEQDPGRLARLPRRPARPAPLLPARRWATGWAGCCPCPRSWALTACCACGTLGQNDALSWVLIPLLGFTVAGCCLTAIVYGLAQAAGVERPLQSAAAPEAPAGATSWATIWAIVLALMIGAAVLMTSIGSASRATSSTRSRKAARSPSSARAHGTCAAGR